MKKPLALCEGLASGDSLGGEADVNMSCDDTLARLSQTPILATLPSSVWNVVRWEEGGELQKQPFQQQKSARELGGIACDEGT
jgi:hypothetical protein